MTLPGSDAAAWLRSAIGYQIERGDVMSEDNGFVERPADWGNVAGMSKQTLLLIETAENGKAIRVPRPMSAGNNGSSFKRRGLRVHVRRQPDGTYLAWCERIVDPVKAP